MGGAAHVAHGRFASFARVSSSAGTTRAGLWVAGGPSWIERIDLHPFDVADW